MRQAGRSLPEYRAARGPGSILDAIPRPELVAELTRQPVRRYGTDAAIFFSDIVVPVAAIGFGVDVAPGTGPVVERPFRSKADLAAPPSPRARGRHALRHRGRAPAGRRARRPAHRVRRRRPSPWPATWWRAGRRKNFTRIKSLMHGEPAIWQELVDRLTDMALASLRSQIDAGASAVQVFDSWAGILTPRHYEALVLPATRRLFAELAASHPGTPTILFGVGTGELLALMATAGSSVVGIDWRVPAGRGPATGRARRRRPGEPGPGPVPGPWEVAEAETRDVLRRAGDAPGHIFNLGHGVLPETDPAILEPWSGWCTPRDGPAWAGGVSAGAPVGVLVMAHGTPATLTDRGLLHGHPAGPAAHPRAPGRADRSVRGDRRRLTPDRADPGPGGRPGRRPGGGGPRWRSWSARGQVRLPDDRGGRGRLAAGGVDRSWAWSSRPTSRRSGPASTSAGPGAAAAAATTGLGTSPSTDGTRPRGSPRCWPPAPTAVLDRPSTPAAGGRRVLHRPQPPHRVVAEGDPYPEEVAGRRRTSPPCSCLTTGRSTWEVAWQSAGGRPTPGSDPTSWTRSGGWRPRGRPVVVCPVGFVSDHLEVLYDLDIEALAGGPVGRCRVRPDPVAQRRPGVPRRAGRGGRGGRRRS